MELCAEEVYLREARVCVCVCWREVGGLFVAELGLRFKLVLWFLDSFGGNVTLKVCVLRKETVMHESYYFLTSAMLLCFLLGRELMQLVYSRKIRKW